MKGTDNGRSTSVEQGPDGAWYARRGESRIRYTHETDAKSHRWSDSSSETPKADAGKAKEQARLEDGLILVNLGTIKAESVVWMWREWLALGKLHVIAGMPGVGKSTLVLWIASRLTKGDPWPDGAPPFERGPCSVLVISDEDGMADSIRPRVEAAGGDASKIEVLDVVRVTDEDGKPKDLLFSLGRDMERLEATLKRRPEIKFVIVDPLGAYLGGVDTHNDSQVRVALGPLQKLAEKYAVAVVAVMHPNKASGGVSMDRIIGSRAFTGAPRLVHIVARDKNDEDLVKLACSKSNCGAKPSTLGFRLVLPEGGEEGEIPHIEWVDGCFEESADDLVAPAEKETPEKRGTVKEWLRRELAGGVKVAANDIKAAGLAMGYSWGTIKRAKDEMPEVRSKKQTGSFIGAWDWWIDETEPPISYTTGEPMP